jgi:putative FmdB family regulatory protein
MPIYEYYCPACGCRFDKWVNHVDGLEICCEKCGNKKVEKQISLSSFRLKGTGWYKTDYGCKKSVSGSS